MLGMAFVVSVEVWIASRSRELADLTLFSSTAPLPPQSVFSGEWLDRGAIS